MVTSEPSSTNCPLALFFIFLRINKTYTTPKLLIPICHLIKPLLTSPKGRDKDELSSYGGFAEGVHLFPYRTEKLSPSWPMVLHKNVGE